MAWVLIIHRVAGYDAWKRAFDEAAPLRRAGGEHRFQVLADDSDRNHVVHLSQWTSLDHARRFFDSPRVAEIRERAGVEAPQFLYLNELDAGVLS